MKLKKRLVSVIASAAIAATSVVTFNETAPETVSATNDISASYKWDTLEIGGGGFVSGIIAGQKEMYLRTDVGGAYRYDYDKMEWVQLFDFVNDSDRGYLSVKGIAIDPTDDMTAYFLCGCAYFSDAKTAIFKTTDGGKTFTESDVTDMIQVHGNGDGRECSEPIAVDPDDPNTIYAGGDVYAGDSALIKSTDGGKTWKSVKGYADAVAYPYTILWPFWTNHTVKAITVNGDQTYAQQNGIATIKIVDGKVYVGTSVTGEANVHVADVATDKFEPLSADLPTANYPVTISDDGQGNIFVTYIAGLAFSGAAGGAYKYNTKDKTVTDISPSGNAIGMIVADKKDPNKLLARTCGVWSDQWYGTEWTADDPNTPENESTIAWGDHFFRSSDAGKTWEDITPGQGPIDYSTGTGVKDFVSLPIDTNGYKWVYGKACHWGSCIIPDPRNPEHIYLTSGNGVFRCDNTWDKKGVQFYFDPKGIEEVVSLDFVSVPGRNPFSAIGDYDGYEHISEDEIGLQYNPNMGSTCAIAYCPQNPDIMLRVAEGDANNQASGYYSKDGGKTWTGMKVASGGKAAITELSEGKYRFLKSGKESGAVQYSDDWGATWENASGISGYKPSYFLVDPKDPSLIYASGIIYNQYWSSNPNAKEPTFDEDHYSMFVSHDYGKTWEENPICRYDMCDAAGDPAYLSDGKLAMAAGWQGLYIITDEGKKAEKTDVFYAKTVGYGCPKKAGDPNTLFIYGKPAESDPEGIYFSEDEGKTWVCINTEHLYGGTGNGNYLVGDMNTYGEVYMSTVGCGIVYGKLAGEPDPKPIVTTTAASATQKSTSASTTTTTTVVTSVSTDDDEPTTAPTEPQTGETVESFTGDTSDFIYGDVDINGDVELADAVTLIKYLANPAKYSLGNGTAEGDERAKEQANVEYDFSIDGRDSSKIIEFILGTLTLNDLGPER